MSNTIEIQITTSTTQTKVVQLPYCTKSETGMYYDKITIEGKSIRIEPKDNCIKVLNFDCTNDIEITEEEFNAKFNEVLENIKSLNK